MIRSLQLRSGLVMQLPGPTAPGSSAMALLRRLRAFIQAGDPVTQIRVLVLLAVGWLLSPLCWWNDLLINLPIAYGVGLLVKHWKTEWFAGGMIIGYWLSNVAGIVLMQSSALQIFQNPGDQNQWRRDLLWGLITSTVYTGIVAVLVHFDWIQTPINIPTPGEV